MVLLSNTVAREWTSIITTIHANLPQGNNSTVIHTYLDGMTFRILVQCGSASGKLAWISLNLQCVRTLQMAETTTMAQYI